MSEKTRSKRLVGQNILIPVGPSGILPVNVHAEVNIFNLNSIKLKSLIFYSSANRLSYNIHHNKSLIDVPSAHVWQPCLQSRMWKNKVHMRTRIFANCLVKIYEK